MECAHAGNRRHTRRYNGSEWGTPDHREAGVMNASGRNASEPKTARRCFKVVLVGTLYASRD